MTTFVNNDVASGNVIYAADHNTQGALLAGVLNGNVDASNLADSGVTTSKVADTAITTSKILDSNVTTAKIADNNVTAAKLATTAITLGYTEKTSNTVVTGTSYSDLSGLSQTVTVPSGGRDVYISFFSSGGKNRRCRWDGSNYSHTRKYDSSGSVRVEPASSNLQRADILYDPCSCGNRYSRFTYI
jgi:hypothetical protein